MRPEKEPFPFRCGEPPEAGARVWRGDAPGVIAADGSWRPLATPDLRPPLRDRIADWLFCTACLRLRMSPGHLMFCRDPRMSTRPAEEVDRG